MKPFIVDPNVTDNSIELICCDRLEVVFSQYRNMPEKHDVVHAYRSSFYGEVGPVLIGH